MMDKAADERNKKATFVVEVQFQRNSTWQGTIKWLDERKVQGFRSTLEMVKLMDEALAASVENDDGTFNSWDELAQLQD